MHMARLHKPMKIYF